MWLAKSFIQNSIKKRFDLKKKMPKCNNNFTFICQVLPQFDKKDDFYDEIDDIFVDGNTFFILRL